MGAEGIVVQPSEGLVQNFTPGRFLTMKLLGVNTADSVMLFEETAPPGTKSWFHLHRDSDEIAYVLSGEVTFLIGGEVTVGRPGACAFMPRRAACLEKHRRRNRARAVSLYSRQGGWVHRGAASHRADFCIDD